MKCSRCKDLAVVTLPSHHAGFCRDCFFLFFRNQVERAITRQKMFTREDRILVAISGGKDSLALTWQLKDLGFDVSGLHIDLGIDESSAVARTFTENFCRKFDIPLQILEMAAHGLAMPLVKKKIKRPVCSVCGSVKRYYFNKTAIDQGFTVLATGHNLNDEVARLFSNVLSWDEAYLSGQGPVLEAREGFVRKVKPLYRLTEFETANFAFLRSIEYGHHPCPFSKGASFSFYKTLWEELEHEQPGRKLSFYELFLKQGRARFQTGQEREGYEIGACTTCGFPTSQDVCSVCRLKLSMADD